MTSMLPEAMTWRAEQAEVDADIEGLADDRGSAELLRRMASRERASRRAAPPVEGLFRVSRNAASRRLNDRPGTIRPRGSQFRRVPLSGTETLINLLGIRDPKRLEVAERRLVRTRLREGLPRAADPRTYPGFMTIHHHRFQDVFGWRGAGAHLHDRSRRGSLRHAGEHPRPGWRSSSPCSASSMSSAA